MEHITLCENWVIINLKDLEGFEHLIILVLLGSNCVQEPAVQEDWEILNQNYNYSEDLIIYDGYNFWVVLTH